MLSYIKNNLTAILALVVSIAGFLLSFKNYIKSNVKLKLSYNIENSYSLGFLWYAPYKLLVIDLTIENNSTSSVDISRIKLIDGDNTYLASTIKISDTYNKNGISLINKDVSAYKPINITSENILNNQRIPSYGVLNGFAVFTEIEPIKESITYKIIVDTPSKSFNKKISITPLIGEFHPIHPLEN